MTSFVEKLNSGIRILLFLILFVALPACSEKELEVSLTPGRIVGSVQGFSSLDLQAASCEPPRATLYQLGANGSRLAALQTVDVEKDGTYVLSVRDLKVNLAAAETVEYLVEVASCGKVLSRPVTGYRKQDISVKTTLIERASMVEYSGRKPLTASSKQLVDSLIGELAELDATTLEEVFSAVRNQVNLSQRFESVFNMPVAEIQNSSPLINQVNSVNVVNEMSSAAFSVSATHWHPDYTVAYLWKLDGVKVSTSANYTYVPGQRSQGLHTLDLFVGKSDGVGGLDLGKAYLTRSFVVSVNDTYPALPPVLSLASASVTNSQQVTLSMATGAGLSNCESFESLALTEDSLLAPWNPADFNITCTTAGSQILSYTLAPGDGVRTLRLWARDTSGQISSIASSVSVTLDQTAPVISISSLPSVIKGGSVQDVVSAYADSVSGLSSVSLQYAANGLDFSEVVSMSLSSGTVKWPVPSTDVTGAKLRIVALDQAGNSQTQETAAFAIDSTPPAAPLISLQSPSISNLSTAVLTVTCRSDDFRVLYSSSAEPPNLSDYRWETCLAGKSFTAPPGDGLKSIYAFSRDLVGHISSGSKVEMTLDQTPPTLALLSPLSGHFRGGATQTFTWSAVDANWGTRTLDLDYSLDQGVTWESYLTALQNDGTQTGNLPIVNSNQVKFRIRGCDLVGNCSVASSTNSLVVDSQAPILSSVVINDGNAFAGTPFLNIKVQVADNFSSASSIQLRLREANAGTLNCQSEYADDGWVSYQSPTANINYLTAPVDGVKKVCVWAKDSVGNVSIFSPVAGTASVNFDTIEYLRGNPPQVALFEVTRTSDGTNNAAISQALTIAWRALDVEGLDSNPISFAYTTDNSVWRDVITRGDISNAANMTWHGGLSSQSTDSGQQVLTIFAAPSSTYFRLRAILRDASGNLSVPAMSQPFNLSGWSVYAGSLDRGVNGTANAVVLNASGSGSLFAMNPNNGDIYALDEGRGVRKLSAQTGIVTTFLEAGTNNLPANGAMPSPARMNLDSHFAHLTFDLKGRLYIGEAVTTAIQRVWQFDLETNSVRLYVGGGTDPTVNDGGVSPTSLYMAYSKFAFDESNSMYFFTACSLYGQPSYSVGKRLLKLTQNPDGTAGSVTRVIGNCSYSSPVSGQLAVDQSVGALQYSAFAPIAVWNNGNTIYYGISGGTNYKILNGVVFTTGIGSMLSGGSYYYNSNDQRLYLVNGSNGIDKVTPNLDGAGGDVVTSFMTGSATGLGCNDDGMDRMSFCGRVANSLYVKNGITYFSDGVYYNSTSAFQVRYIDSLGKIQTLMGTKPLYGIGLNARYARGSFGGIYYKKLSEPNQAAFPEGLYFSESRGVVFGRINPVSQAVEVVWGNQHRKTVSHSNGEVISAQTSMGTPYVVNGSAFTFDDTGLPWLRVDSKLVKINAAKQKEVKLGGGGYWHDVVDRATNLSSFGLHVYAGGENLALKGQSLFLSGSAYVYLVSNSVDPRVRMMDFDFTGNIALQLMGGSSIRSQAKPAPADVTTPGAVAATDMWYACAGNGSCPITYDANTDRLYFLEDKKVRYIYPATNPESATLTTHYTHSLAMSNISVNPSGTQIWVIRSSGVYCVDVSSGKSWCNGTTNHFTPSAAGGFGIGKGPNQIAWASDSEMFLSDYSGQIWRFVLPSGP